MNKARPIRIVICGAGFGGLATAVALERLCGRTHVCEIVLLDRSTEHVYTPLLYEVATGYLDETPEDCEGELRRGVCLRFEQYTTILGTHMIRFLHGTVRRVDPEKRVIEYDGGSLPFDYAVIALGATLEDFGVPGVREHAFALKTLTDAMRLRKRLRGFVQKHLAGDKERIAVTICGGGATGVELASELATFFEKLRRAEITKHRHTQITLLEAGPKILAAQDETIRRLVTERLEVLGVQVRTNTRVQEVKADAVVLSPDENLVSDVTVWSGGIRPAVAPELFSGTFDKRGRVVVDPTLQARGAENVFVLGDCAAMVDPRTEESVPALAQVAVAEGSQVARNIVRLMAGEATVPYVPPTHWNMVLPLGGKYAVASIDGLHLKGFLAYLMRKAADFWYFRSILPLHYALHLFWRGARVYVKND